MIDRLLTLEIFYLCVDLLRQDVVAVGDHLVLGGEEAEQLDCLVSLPLENWVMLATNQKLVFRGHQPIRTHLDHHHSTQNSLLLPRDPAPGH